MTTRPADASFWRIDEGAMPGCPVGSVIAIMQDGPSGLVIREGVGRVLTLDPSTSHQTSAPDFSTITLVNQGEGWQASLTQVPANFAVSFTMPAGSPLSQAQAREDARAAVQGYMVVMGSKEFGGKILPGHGLARILFDAAERGSWPLYERAVTMICGARNRDHWRSAVLPAEVLVQGMLAYTEAFCEECQRIEQGLRAGGKRRKELTNYLWHPPVPETARQEWIEAIALFEGQDLQSELGITHGHWG